MIDVPVWRRAGGMQVINSSVSRALKSILDHVLAGRKAE